MKLPAAEEASVDPRKARDYLLSQSHPIGRFKAAFFFALGYSDGDWEALVDDLRGHAIEGVASATEKTEFGQKYEVRGSLSSPTGRSATLVSVWIVRTGEEFPRFVTAFPGARR